MKGRDGFLALLLLGLSGCAQLSVQVDILNAAYWATPEYIDSITVGKIGDAEQAIRDGRFATRRDGLKQSVERVLVTMAGTRPATIDPRQLPTLVANFNRYIDGEFSNARDKFNESFKFLRKAFKETNADENARLFAQASEKFSEAANILEKVGPSLEKDLRQNLSPPADGQGPQALQEQITQVKQKAQTISDGLIGNAGIADDPRASAAVYAPDDFWRRQFNQTYCYGSLGNTDCAVKMDGIASFTIKGVRLDAAKITQATFSVTREAIQTVAAVYGIPVPKNAPANNAPGTTAVTTPADIDSPVKRQQDADANLLQLRLARLAIFETIVGQRMAIAGDQAARNQAVATIKAVVEVNRKQLDPATTP